MTCVKHSAADTDAGRALGAPASAGERSARDLAGAAKKCRLIEIWAVEIIPNLPGFCGQISLTGCAREQLFRAVGFFTEFQGTLRLVQNLGYGPKDVFYQNQEFRFW